MSSLEFPLYPCVAPAKILAAARKDSLRIRVESSASVLHWIETSRQIFDAADTVTATFVIDAEGWMWLADRRSEHAACARGRPVRSAGEASFGVSPKAVEVISITNQSTGYCPQPESWPAVAEALDRAAIDHPGEFTSAFLFRRCACGQINIIKDGVYECGVCGGELSIHSFLPL